jgi:hypothetical protein
MFRGEQFSLSSPATLLNQNITSSRRIVCLPWYCFDNAMIVLEYLIQICIQINTDRGKFVLYTKLHFDLLIPF